MFYEYLMYITNKKILHHNFSIMKKLICLLLSICCFTGMYAQNTFSVSGGTRLVTTGGVQVVLGQGNLTNNGTISGSAGGGATWIFKGPIIFNGSGSTTVTNLVIDHSYGITQLNSVISVMNTATLAAGNLISNDNLFIRSDLNSSANLVVVAIPTGTIQGLTVKTTVSAGPCPSYTPSVSVNISGPQITFQWQTSGDNTTWSNVTGATNNSFTPTVTGPVFVRCLLGATTGNYVDTANPIKLVFNDPDATISGSNSLVLGNTANLTGALAGGTWSSNNANIISVDPTTGLITATGLGIATVTYAVTNSSGCTARNSYNVSVTSSVGAPVVTTTNPAAVCAPGTVNLTAAAVTAGSDPGLTYTYFTNAAGTTVLSNPSAVSTSGTYYIKGTNSTNVSSGLVPVVVTVNTLPSGTITSAQGAVLCGTGASLSFIASGGSTYNWFRNGVAVSGVTGNQLTVTTTGIYTATLISAAGCQASASNNITVTSSQNPKASFSFDSYCINKPVTFTNLSTVTGSGTVNYQWSDNAGNTSSLAAPVFTYTAAGNFTVKLKVTSQACPGNTDSISIPLPIEAPLSAIRMKPPVDVVINEAASLAARNFGKTYLWTPSTGLSDATVANPKTTLTADQEYKIAITVASGCVTVDSLLVRIFENKIYVPNVFTPNGDGINDKLFINLVAVQRLNYFRIYNRNGKVMFETNDATVGWDGKFNNQLQAMDTYVWVAQIFDNIGNLTVRRGTVTLLR